MRTQLVLSDLKVLKITFYYVTAINTKYIYKQRSHNDTHQSLICQAERSFMLMAENCQAEANAVDEHDQQTDVHEEAAASLGGICKRRT